MRSYQVRRGPASLGIFNDRELRALLQKGKLLGTDEFDRGGGKWESLATFMAALPSQTASDPRARAQVVSAPSMPGLNFYLHKGGQRIGPLERAKIEGMVRAGLVDSSAMLEDIYIPGQLDPIGNHFKLSLARPSIAPAPVVHHTPPSTLPSAVSGTPHLVASNPAAKKVSFVDLWVKTTIWIYALGALFGFLAGNLNGFVVALIIGILLAPIKGAFWAWIIWLFKR